MTTKFTFKEKLTKTLALMAGVFGIASSAVAQNPIAAGTTYVVNGSGVDLVAPKDTFANLMGAYTGGAYTNTTGIFNAITVNGVDPLTIGTINIVLAPGYSGVEPGSMIQLGSPTLGAFNFMASTRPILVRPAGGHSVTITTTNNSNANEGVIRLNGVSFITFDGESSPGQNNLTVRTAAGASNNTAKVFDLIGVGQNGCQNITIRNTNIVGHSTTAAVNTFAGINIGGVTAGSNAARRSQNILIENNRIEAVRNGIHARGVAATVNSHDLNLIIRNNTIGGDIPTGTASNTTYIGGVANAAGIYLAAQSGAIIEGNIIKNNIPSLGNFRGIELTAPNTQSRNINITINGNRIYRLGSTVANQGVWGIRSAHLSDTDPRNITITNNIIAKIYATQPGSVAGNFNTYPSGILLEETSPNLGINIYHNTIHLSSDTISSQNGVTSCIVLSPGVEGGYAIRNNIISNADGRALTNAASSAVIGYGVVITRTLPIAVTGVMSNNAFYLNTTRGGYSAFGTILNRNRFSLLEWQQATGSLNDITFIPPFVPTGNDTTCVIPAGIGSAIATAGLPGFVSTDINGIVRTSTPTIGAQQITQNNATRNFPLTGNRTFQVNGVNNWPQGAGGNGTFATVADAINYVNHYGTTGSGIVRLNIAPGYARETGILPAVVFYPGAALARPVVVGIEPGYNDTLTMPAVPTYNQQTVLRVLGSRHFRVNGSGTAGQRNLTIALPSNATNNSARVVAVTPTDTLPVSSIWIENSNIIGQSTPTAINTFVGIYSGNYNSGTLTNSSPLVGFNDEINIRGNFIQAVRNGIFIRGANIGGRQNRNWNINRNIIGGTIAPGGSQPTTFIGGNTAAPTDQAGIMLKGVAMSTIDSNVIRNCFNTGTASNQFAGIRLEAFSEQGLDSALVISRNQIYNLTTAGTTVFGIRINLLNQNLRAIRLVNNAISAIRSTGQSVNMSVNNPAGISMDVLGGAAANFGVSMQFNTINLSGNTLTGASSSSCVYIGANITGGIDMRSNLFSNNLGRVTGTGNAYILNIVSNTNPFAGTANGVSSFNAYSIGAPNSTRFVGASNNGIIPYPGLTEWRNYTTNDAGSVFIDAQFISDTLPNLDLALAGPVQAGATPILGVVTDVFGNPRSGAPCIGAVEFVSNFARLQGSATYLINGVQNPPTIANPNTGSFATINRAIQYLNANGVDEFTPPVRPITLLITNGYAGEGDTLISTVLDYPRQNANRPITLRLDAGRNDTITYTNAALFGNNSSLFRFQGASFFTIDGSNDGSGSRNLTFIVPASVTNNTVKAIDITSGNVPSTSIAIRNCNIVGSSNTTAINTFAGIYMGGLAATPSNPTLGGNNNHQFVNNNIVAVRYGIYLRGASTVAGQQDRNIQIRRNIIGGTIPTGGGQPTTFYGGVANAAGIFLSSQLNTIVDSNIIRNNIPTFNFNSGIELSAISGTQSVDSGIVLSRNRIYNITSTGSAAYGVRIATANASNRGITLISNAISRIHATGTASTTSIGINNPYGVLVEATTNQTNYGLFLYYNSIFMGQDNMLVNNASSSPVYLNNFVSGGVTSINNIYQNRLGAATGTANAYSFLIGSNSTSVLERNDNNNYFVAATNANNRLWARNANAATPVFITSLNDVRTFTQMDTFSFNTFIPFPSDTNLVIPSPTSSQITGNARNLIGLPVNTDINGATRRTFFPSIGANDFTGVFADSTAASVFNLTSTANCNLGPTIVTLRVIERNIATDTLYYRVNGGAESFVLNTSNELYTRVFTIPTQAQNSTIEWRYSVNDASPFAFNTRFPETGYLPAATVFTTFPVAYGFDGPNTQGWSVQQVAGNGGWDLSSFGSPNLPILSPQTGVRAALFPSQSLPVGTVSRLVSPCVSLEGKRQPTVRFWMSQNADVPNNRDSINFVVSLGGSWFPVNRSFVRVNPSLAFPGYTQFDVCLSDYIGIPGMRFGFEAVSRGGNNIVLDSVILFDDILNLPITPNPAYACEFDSIRLNIQNTNFAYEYRFANIFNPLDIISSSNSYVIANRQGTVNFTAPHSGQDSLYLRLQYTNVLSGCSNIMNDTVKVFVPKYNGGPFVRQGTPFQGGFTVGTELIPDGAKPGDVLTYEIFPPSGLTNNQFGTRWTIVSATARTASNAAPASAVLNNPAGGQNARFVITPNASNDDSLYRILIHIRQLPSNCDSIIERWLKITTPPTAQITFFGSTTFCALEQRTFANTSIVPAQTLPATYLWEYGDGTTSTTFSGSHRYRNPGQYTVRLTVTNKFGLTSTATQNVTILEAPNPAISFTQACAGLETRFNSIVPANTDSVRWTFSLGGNVLNVNSNRNPLAILPTADTTYQITLRAINNLQCANDTTITVYAFPRPVAAFTAQSHCAGTLFPVNNSSTILTNRPNNSFGSEWNFGNGQTGLANQPVYTFPQGGTFTVQLKVTTNFGCTDSVSQQITVRSAPDVDFAVGTNCQFDDVRLTNNTSFPGGLSTVNFTWDFGDNSPVSNEINPTKAYGALGTYQIKLSAVDAVDGCRDSLVRTVIIRQKPTAAFNVNAQNCLGDLVQFNNASSQNTTFEWNFGDNSPVSTQENPSHLYTASGLYNVSLIATNNFGCSDTITRPVSATQPAAVPFTVTIDTLASPWQATFNASVTGLASYRWDFGDGRTGNGASITHTYTRGGQFDVVLTVSDANNCTNSTTQSIRVDRGVGLGDVLASKYAFNMSPNPFTDIAKVRFSLDQASEVKIEVYDMMGRKLKSYDMQQLAQGDHLVDINANDFKAKAGAYMIKVSINDETFTRTLIHNK